MMIKKAAEALMNSGQLDGLSEGYEIAARDAIRAVFEHLRDNALPHAVRLALEEKVVEEVSDDVDIGRAVGERIFLAGIEKLLETLGK